MDCETTDPAWRVCSVATTLEMVGGRWKAPILFYLLGGTRRFGEIRRCLPGITQRMLTLQLRELEKDGVVTRRVYAEVPPRVEYSLTDLGRTLKPVLTSMSQWGQVYETRLNCGRAVKGQNGANAELLALCDSKEEAASLARADSGRAPSRKRATAKAGR
jgi:DNA-binding HxlR family transcriptional regulator